MLKSLLKWRLSLASFPIEELEPILWTLQQGLFPIGQGGNLNEHWLSNLMSSVCELAQKPLTVVVDVHAPLRLECSLWEALTVVSKIYLDIERDKVRKKFELAKAAAEVVNQNAVRRKSSLTKMSLGGMMDSTPEEHENVENSPQMRAAEKSVLDVQNVMSVVLELVNEITLTLSTIAAGGDGGVLGIRLDDLDADLCLPKNPFQQLYAPMEIPLKFDPSWTTGQRGPGQDEYTIKMFEVSDEAWDLNENHNDDSECKAALKSDAAVEIVVGAARIDLFPTFSFGGGNDNKVATAAVSASSPTSNESGKSLSSSGETKSTTASSFQKPKKAVKTRGALRARAASVRVTLLLRMIIDAIREAAAAAQIQQRLEAVSLARTVRARSDSRTSMSSEAGYSHGHHSRDGSNLGPRRRASRRASSGSHLITDTAILEALNVAEILLPYIEDTERALHFQLNGLTVKIDCDGQVIVQTWSNLQTNTVIHKYVRVTTKLHA